MVERGRRPREYAPALRDLEKAQKTRAKRRHLDVVDRGLIDLVSVYRDAIAVATGAPGGLVNEDIRDQIDRIVQTSSPELNLRRIGWIFAAREQMLEFNVPVALALESMMVALRVPDSVDRRAGPEESRVKKLIVAIVVIWPWWSPPWSPSAWCC